MDGIPADAMQDEPIGGSKPADPFSGESVPPSELWQPQSAGATETATQPSGEAPEDASAVHTFQVSHFIRNPENPGSHSVFHSAEVTVDEAIAWIRERLLHS